MASGEHDPAFASAMRSLSRSHIADTWKRGRGGETLSGEDAAFYQAMCDHPEYENFFERAAELSDHEVEADGVNPFLHVSLHSVVERQIADNNPPETARALFRLTRAGLERHEAVHRIAGVLVEMLSEMLRENKPFDHATFARRLRSIEP